MINLRRIIMLTALTMLISTPALALPEVELNSKDIINEKAYVMHPNCKCKPEDCKDPKFEEMKKKKHEQIAMRNNTILKADSVVPGIKGQWEEVIKERKEIINQIIEKERNRKPEKEIPHTQDKEFKKIGDESMKTAWEDFSKAVEANNVEEIKKSFDKFLSLHKEINNLLKEKLSTL